MARFYACGEVPGPLRLTAVKPGYDVTAPSIPTEGIAFDLDLHGGGYGSSGLYLAGVRRANTLTGSVIVSFPETLPYVPQARVLMSEATFDSPPAPQGRIANYSFYSVITYNDRIEVENAGSSWGANFWFWYFVYLTRTF